MGWSTVLLETPLVVPILVPRALDHEFEDRQIGARVDGTSDEERTDEPGCCEDPIHMEENWRGPGPLQRRNSITWTDPQAVVMTVRGVGPREGT